MQLPRYKKLKRKKLKVCKEPGCGKEYIGHPISKYCELHRDIANRARKIKEFEPVHVKNFVFKHGFTDVTEMELICQLDGCNNKYTVKIYPKQHIYPKFCGVHRSEYKRESLRKRTE
jgi:hypothetical protein